MVIKYVGQKKLPYILQTPIPFISKSEANGELRFDPTCTVTNEEWAAFLLDECGDAFELVEGALPEARKPFTPVPDEEKQKRHAEKVQQTIGKKFRGKPGKWQAQAYLRRHRLTQELGLKKLQISGMVMHWEVVPIAMADVMVGDTGVEPISESSEGPLEETHHERDSDRESIEV